MRIGILLPSVFSIDNPGNGIAEQARQQAAALERLGHTVVRLSPWQWQDEANLDVLHMHLGGLMLHSVGHNRRLIKPGILAFTPHIDSNQSFVSYRLAAALGSVSSRVTTVPGSLRDQAQCSDVVICRSVHEQQRVQQGLGISSEKIDVVLNGCDLPVADFAEVERILRKLDLPERFLLHIGAYTQPRKNVLRLAEAARQLGYPLVIAGHAVAGVIQQQLERDVSKTSNLRMLGYVDAATKTALYTACAVFCLPSTHEGTGLVALEAASHGANVVITRNGGPPDYFGDHAEYVDPGSVQDIKGAIARAWQKPRNTALKQHVTNHLTWDHSAKRLEEVYTRFLQNKHSLPGVASMTKAS